MAGVKLEFISNPVEFLAMRKIAAIFPEIRAQMLGYIGTKGKSLLYFNFLRGQELNYRGETDRRGRKKVSYTITKNATAVKIRSYPANLFEKGRKLRSGRMEPGKFIISRKFKNEMNGGLQGILDNFDRMYLQRKLDKI